VTRRSNNPTPPNKGLTKESTEPGAVPLVLDQAATAIRDADVGEIAAAMLALW
jgi:hypothetical protein